MVQTKKSVAPASGNGVPRLVDRPLSRSLRVYQKIAIVFVVLSFLLLLAVLYLSISQATISVTPVPKVVSTTAPVELTPTPAGVGQAAGVVVEQTVTKAKTFTLPSEGGTAVDTKAGVKVTLINDTGSAQALVATTRLLSKEGVLFRIDEAVNIPAKGQVEAMAHADVPGVSGEIPPTQFTIPGLGASLQKSIYAVSIDKATGGVSNIHVVTQQDLDQAEATLTDEILEETKDVLRAMVDAPPTGEAFTINVTNRVSDTPPGTETGSFIISITAEVTGIFYDKATLATYMRDQLASALPDGRTLASVNTDGLQVTVKSSDPAKKMASVTIYLDGVAVLDPSSDVLDKDRFVGRSPDEVVTLLKASEDVEDVRISFTPFWLKRIPTLTDHIKVVVEEPKME